MSEIKELSNKAFNVFLNKYMSFLSDNPIEKGICIYVEANRHGFPVKFINHNVDWEGFNSVQESLESLYVELFKNQIFSGDVLLFYPFSKTKSGNSAVIISADKLKDFLIKKHIEIYPEFFDIEMSGLGFYFFDENIFYGMEHPDFLYYFKMK